MWHAYILFYETVSEGDWSAWWSPHNEHRLILDHPLFWADLHWFHGGTVVMLAMNFVLASLLVAAFWFLLARRIPGAQFSKARLFVGFLITGILFLLCQGENFTWNQDNQFWFVFLFSLWALYFLQKDHEHNLSKNYWLACLFAFLAAGSMANGIVTLPLLAAYCILTRQNIRRIGVLVVFSVAVFFLYRLDSTGHVFSASEVIKHPARFAAYTLALLGGPILFLFKSEPLRQVLGFLFVLAAVYKGASILRKPRADRFQTALLFYVLFILISVLGITNGRMSQDIAATSARYTTVSLAGWITLLILYAPSLVSLRPAWKTGLAVAVLPLLALSVKAQVHALDNWDEPLLKADQVILGIALGANDLAGMTDIAGPGEAAYLLPTAGEKAYQQHLSVWGWYPYRDVRRQLGKTVATSANLPSCQGSVEAIVTISDPRFIRIQGRLVNATGMRPIKAVRILDKANREIGFAVMGHTTPDLDPNLAKRALDQQYRGYVLAKSAGADVALQGEDQQGSICSARASLPAPLYLAYSASPDSNLVTAHSEEIESGNQWTGSDFSRTDLSNYGLRVYGSFKQQGDADTGSITLHLMRGDRVLYRSGPTGGNQTFEIAGKEAIQLPAAKDWVLLDFSSPTLPTGPFAVKFTDAGSGWGEWSALAVRDDRSSTPFLVRAALPPYTANVDAGRILGANGWTGSDYAHSNLCSSGLRVFGTYKQHGDAEIGSLTIRLQRGDSILYRSGPIRGNQTVRIGNGPLFTLPVAEAWTSLDFSGAVLAKTPFKATFTDSGTGWGEWSAIAVRDDKACSK